jgi:hypothetical protein
MTYTINESRDAAYFTPGAQVAQVFGTPRQQLSITIHHWGALGQHGPDILDWFCNPDTTARTSAHFVVWDGNIYCIVSPLDAAWHAGNAYGNATSIGIECHPEATDGDYATVAWLIQWLRGTYGDLPLFPHNHWTSTTCPGNWDLARLDQLARAQPAISPASNTVTPITPEDDMPYSQWPQADKDALVNDLKAALAPAVWEGPGAWVANRRLGHNEYAETILGSLEDRIQHEILAPALADAVNAINGNTDAAVKGIPVAQVDLTDAQVQSLADKLGPDLIQRLAVQFAKP